MICNSSLTVYHKGFNENMLETWTRFNYDKVWYFGGKGANIDKGYENVNDLSIRIPYKQNENLNIDNFSIGDIVVKGTLNQNITSQKELKEYEIYNIKTLKNNTFGNEQHIYIGGK